jgi:deazaflavin-dependent oxidoreductase (nitroreductase family)
VVVASRGGDDRHPAWYLNLRERPDVKVSLKGGPRTPMRARIVEAEERARLWPQIADRYANYAGYQRRTEREIPLVVLEPAP